jgi:hypothetical protein
MRLSLSLSVSVSSLNNPFGSWGCLSSSDPGGGYWGELGRGMVDCDCVCADSGIEWNRVDSEQWTTVEQSSERVNRRAKDQRASAIPFRRVVVVVVPVSD